MTALLLLALLQAQDPVLQVSVDRDRVNVGDEVVLTVVATSHGLAAVRVELPALDGFTLLSRGERTQVGIGADPVRELTYELRLRAVRAGTWQLGPVRATQGTTVVTADGPEVEVTESPAAGLLALNPRVRDLVARAPPPKPGKVTLAVLVSQDSVRVGEQVDVVTAAWFPRDLRQQLRRQPVLQPPVLDGVWSYPQAAPPGIAASRRVGGSWYDMFIAHQIVFPIVAGRVNVPAAELRYSVPVAMQFFSQEERLTVRSEPREIAVAALPQAGVPAGFAGATGRDLRLERRLLPPTLRAGEAVAVELTISGEGNLALWPEPSVAWPAEARSYPDGSVEQVEPVAGRLGGAKRFKYVLVPAEAGVLRIPAVRYPWFDTGAGAYRVAEVPALTLAVAPAGEASAARPLPPPLLSPGGTGLAHRLVAGMRWWAWALVALLPPLAGALLRRRPWRRGPGAARRAAPGDPLAELERALAQLVPADEAAAPERLVPALRAAGVDDAGAREIAALRESVLRARFGPPGAEVPARADVERVLARVVGVVRGRGAGAALLLLASLLAAPLRAQGAAPAETLYAHGALRAAAEAFTARVTTAPADPAAWYALGATRYRLGEDGAAAAAWLTALRLAPREDAVRRALDLVPPPDPASRWRRLTPPVTPEELLLAGLAVWVLGWALVLARRLPRAASIGLLVVAAGLVGAGAGLRAWYGRPVAVAVQETPLRGAPTGRAAPGRTLPPGSTLVAWRRFRGWTLVEAGPGELGWVPDAAIARVHD